MSYANRSYQNIIIGSEVRRSIAGTTTYRVRRGNGYYGSVLGEKYQDKFGLVIPSSINNVESAAYRTLLSNAVAYWKNTLSESEKKEYNRQASHGLQMSGYNLFVRKVILGEVIL